MRPERCARERAGRTTRRRDLSSRFNEARAVCSGKGRYSDRLLEFEMKLQ